MSRFRLLVLDAPCTERYARCGERTGVNHPLLLDYEKGRQLTACSMGLRVLTVLFLAMTREAYAIVVAFLLFVIKMALIWMSRA